MADAGFAHVEIVPVDHAHNSGFSVCRVEDHTVKFGVYLPNQGPFADARVLASLGAEAEVAGWDGLFIWDAMFPIFEHSTSVTGAVGDSRDVADPFIVLTAVAASTDRIRLGALVTPVARLRPETVAQASVTLDRFSDGRLILGVGLGNPDTTTAMSDARCDDARYLDAGDTSVACFVGRGRNDGQLGPFPASNQQLAFDLCEILTYDDAGMVEADR